PCRALPPRPAQPRAVFIGPRRSRLARRGRDSRRCPRADHGRCRDERGARLPDRATGQAATRLCPPPVGLSRTDAPIRYRRADVGRDPRRARRLPTLLLLAPGRALLRAGHHGLPVRRATQPRPPLPPGTARVALGALRGRAGRPASLGPGSRLLRASRPAAPRQPRLSRNRPQAPTT